MGWLLAFWHFVFGWPSVAILIGAAATAIALVVPGLRRLAIIVAVVVCLNDYFRDRRDI